MRRSRRGSFRRHLRLGGATAALRMRRGRRSKRRRYVIVIVVNMHKESEICWRGRGR
jgi:hypothetical protein